MVIPFYPFYRQLPIWIIPSHFYKKILPPPYPIPSSMIFQSSQPPTGVILGNLRVRISDPWEKSSPRKIFEILFWLETFKNDHSWSEEVRLQVPLSSICMLLLPKNTLFFLELLFIFQNCPFVSWNWCVVFIFFSRSVFLFFKCALLFSRIAT